MNSKELLNEILLENSNLEEALNGAEYTSQAEALIQMLMGNNVFLSGPAGSGKSFVIRKYCELLESKYPIKLILSPTFNVLVNVVFLIISFTIYKSVLTVIFYYPFLYII